MRKNNYFIKRNFRQRGAALILALLIVAIVSVMATQFAFRFKLSVTRVENRWHGAQSQYYLLGAENLAMVYLKQDLEDTEIDDLLEQWATELPPMPTDHGMLEAKIVDAQGFINLNNLQEKVQQDENQVLQPWQRFTEAQKNFIRLLQCFDDYPIDEDQAIEITEAVIDWLDPDDEETGYGGAESIFYSRAEPPYLPANRQFSSVSELRLLRHMTPELYERIQPWLVVLPQATTINVNTAPAMVLRTINDMDVLQPAGEMDISTLVEDRDLKSFESVAEFFDNPVVQNIYANPAQNDSGLGVSTEYFILYGRATTGDTARTLVSSIARSANATFVYGRRYDLF